MNVGTIFDGIYLLVSGWIKTHKHGSRVHGTLETVCNELRLTSGTCMGSTLNQTELHPHLVQTGRSCSTDYSLDVSFLNTDRDIFIF